MPTPLRIIFVDQVAADGEEFEDRDSGLLSAVYAVCFAGAARPYGMPVLPRLACAPTEKILGITGVDKPHAPLA